MSKPLSDHEDTFVRNVGRGYAKLMANLGNGYAVNEIETDLLSDFADDLRYLLDILDRHLANREDTNLS